MMKNRLSLIILFILTAFTLPAFEVNDINLHLKITGITDATAPEVWRDYLILTAKPINQVRFVGAAFSTDSFQKIHSYQKNSPWRLLSGSSSSPG